MTYRIERASAITGDLVDAVVHGAVLSVTRNGKHVSHAEYRLGCDHEHAAGTVPAKCRRRRLV
jgi:hypothetical protein